MQTFKRYAIIAALFIVALAVVMPEAFGQPIKDKEIYIVVFHPGKSQKPEDLKLDIKAKRHIKSINGFSAELTPRQLYGLQHNPNIKYINRDRPVQLSPQVATVITLSTQITPPGVVRIGATRHPKFGNVRGIGVGVIDTGIDPHIELNVVGRMDFSGEGGGFDGAGHGTHVAGTIGAINNDIGVVGVAPGIDLYSIKALNSDGSGSYESIIAALDWATQNADKIAVVNMSLGGVGYLQSLDDAVRAAVNAGIVVCVAAGNDGFRDIYGYDHVWGNDDDFTPSDLSEALTVSAMYDIDGYPGGAAGAGDDQMASFSSYSTTVVSWNPVNSPGAGIDLSAPGVNVLSTYKGNAIAILSGTSMATPHTTGMVALYMLEHGRAHNAAEVHAIRQALINEGQPQSQWLVGFTNDKDVNPEPLVYYPGGVPIPTNNHPPVLQVFAPDTTHMPVGATRTFTLVASDPDGDPLQYLIRTGEAVTASITSNILTVTGTADALTWVVVGVVDPYGAVNQKAGWFYVGNPDFPPYMITKFENTVFLDPLSTIQLEVIHGDPNGDPSYIYLNPYDSTNIKVRLIDNGANVSSYVVVTSLNATESSGNQIPLCVFANTIWACVWFYANVQRLHNADPWVSPDPFPEQYVKVGQTITVPMNWGDADGDIVSLRWGNVDAEAGQLVNTAFSIDTQNKRAVITGIRTGACCFRDDRDLVWFSLQDGYGAYVWRSFFIFPVQADQPPPATYNCVNDTCVDPGDGTGRYTTVEECQAACQPPPPVTYNCVSDTCADPGDGSGIYATLAECQFACQPPPPTDTTPPTLEILYPPNGATFKRGTTITVQTVSTDTVGVDRVVLLAGDVTQTKTVPPYNFSWRVPMPPNKSYTLTVTSFDAAGNNVSKSVTIRSTK